MDAELLLPTIVRWLHIGSACLAVGAPFFVRFALIPAAEKSLQPDQFQALKEAMHARWRPIVYSLILLFILTGLYTFFVTARWRELTPDARKTYHMLFGIKTLAAFGIFFLASALAGRSKAFLPIRKSAKTWIAVLLTLAAIVILCGNLMRQLSLRPELPRSSSPASLPNH
jgi:hypothetical protein